MILIQEAIVLLKLPKIPAEIEIIASDVCHLDQGTILLKHKSMGHNGWAQWIHLMAQFI